MKKFKSLKYLMLLHLLILFYSLGSVCSKFASELPFFSFKWCALYGASIFILGVYAILWQQILKNLPLNLAYANKALTLVWGMVFGFLIFKEEITVKNLIGAAIVLAGVIVMLLSSVEKGGTTSAAATKPVLENGEGETSDAVKEEESEGFTLGNGGDGNE